MSAKVWYSPSAHGSRFGPSVAFQCWIYCALEGRAPLEPAGSRARKGADGGIPAEKPGLHNQLRRAVDCAPYRLPALLL